MFIHIISIILFFFFFLFSFTTDFQNQYFLSWIVGTSVLFVSV